MVRNAAAQAPIPVRKHRKGTTWATLQHRQKRARSNSRQEEDHAECSTGNRWPWGRATEWPPKEWARDYRSAGRTVCIQKRNVPGRQLRTGVRMSCDKHGLHHPPPTLHPKSQTHLSDGNAQSCIAWLKHPRNVTPDKSLLKTFWFTSELLPLQKEKFHSSLSPSCLTNSPLTSQQPLAFPIPLILNHFGKEVPGSCLAPCSSFHSNVSEMPFLLCSILLCTAKILPPFPLPLSACMSYRRDAGHQGYYYWDLQQPEKYPQHKCTALASLWNSDLVLEHITEQFL